MPYKDPDVRRKKKAEAARLRRAAESSPRGRPLSSPPSPEVATLKLESAKGALLLLQEQIDIIRALRVDTPGEQMGRARTLAYLIAMGLKILDVVNTEARVVLLEDSMDRLRNYLYAGDSPCPR